MYWTSNWMSLRNEVQRYGLEMDFQRKVIMWQSTFACNYQESKAHVGLMRMPGWKFYFKQVFPHKISLWIMLLLLWIAAHFVISKHSNFYRNYKIRCANCFKKVDCIIKVIDRQSWYQSSHLITTLSFLRYWKCGSWAKIHFNCE